MHLTCLGNAIVDVVGTVDEVALRSTGLPRGTMSELSEAGAAALGASLRGATPSTGGSSANSAAVAAALGCGARYLGKVADDADGRAFAAGMASAGVAFDVPPGPPSPATARCIVLVTPDGERTMGTFLGASVTLSEDDWDAGGLGPGSWLLVEGYLWDVAATRRACEAAMDAARQAGASVALTLSDAGCVSRNRRAFLGLSGRGGVDLVFANAREAVALWGGPDPRDAAMRARAAGGATCVITLSGDGAVVVHRGRRHFVPAHPVEAVVDTTGAGDAYAGGFIAGLARGLDHAAAGRLAAFAAADVVGRTGARAGPDLATRAVAEGLLP